MRTVQREIVAAIIFSKDNKILMGRKDPKSGGVYIDCWHIPGGGIQDGESKTEALAREIKEEVGIDIAGRKLELVDNEDRGVSEKFDKETGEKILVEMYFNVYKVVLNENSNDVNLSLDDDLAEAKWLNLSELRNIKLTPPSVKLFRKLGYIN